MKYLVPYMDQEQIVHYEGRRGTTNLCKIARAIGYKDQQQFGMMPNNTCIGDLIEFLDDNSGAIEAVIAWIGKQRSAEWDEELKSKMTNITQLCNTNESDLDGLEPEEIEALRNAEDNGEDVTVDCEATDGFYDITLADGTEIAALSGYHLKGYDR